MKSFMIDAQITPDRRLSDYRIPDTLPVGHVKLIIQPVDTAPNSDDTPLTRETLRARLVDAGVLSLAYYGSRHASRLSDAESTRLAHLFADETQSVLDLVNEDRGPKG